MHAASRILLLTLALTGWAVADLPKKAPIMKYVGLWTNSPFTSKPPPADPGQVANPLEDYALAGISPVGAGYRVTLINKKKPEERITVDTDSRNSDFKILEVIRKAGDPLGTVVRMTSGSATGTVSFDEKLLVLATPPAAKVPPKLPPGAAPPPQPQPIQPGQPMRQPRPRVVPPPTAQPGAPAAPQNRSMPGQSIPTTQRPVLRGGR